MPELREAWKEEREDLYCLGEMKVWQTVTTTDKTDTSRRFCIVFMPLSDERPYATIDKLNIHQLRDLRTLLNHILGEEDS